MRAVVSRSGASAAKMIEELKLDCKPVTSLDEVLKSKDIDVVIVTTPSGAHMEPAVSAANAGKHVVVEKPLEITLDRCDRILFLAPLPAVSALSHSVLRPLRVLAGLALLLVVVALAIWLRQ